jgi:hypothetical protein
MKIIVIKIINKNFEVIEVKGDDIQEVDCV